MSFSSRLGVWVVIAPAIWAQGAIDSTFFSTKLYSVLEAAGCRGCHTHEGVASGTRLHFPEKDASPECDSDIWTVAQPAGGPVGRVEVDFAQQADQPYSSHRRRADQARLRRRQAPGPVGAVSGVGDRWVAGGCPKPPVRWRGGRQAEPACPAPDSQPVRQHGARPARRFQQAGAALPVGRLCGRLQESVARAEHASAAGRILQRHGRKARAECVPHTATSTA